MPSDTEKKAPNITKTCSLCGEEKPLSAYLQLSAAKEALYSTICATCRSNLPRDKKILDDISTSTSGKKIDVKAKLHLDKERESTYKEKTENELKEKIKEEKEENVTLENKEIFIKGEQKHREEYLKKRSFLADHKKDIKPELVHGSLEQIEKERLELSSGASIVDSLLGYKISFQSSETIKRFKTLLGETSHLVNATEKIHKQNAKKALQKQLQQKNKAELTPENPDTAEEYIKENWGPKRRK